MTADTDVAKSDRNLQTEREVRVSDPPLSYMKRYKWLETL